MEDIQEVTIKSGGGFVNHVFNFDDNTKHELLNLIQYSLLAIIPIIILNKSIKQFIPEVNEEKGSLEILAEVVGQIAIMFLGVYYIHRIITYIPTYSGSQYPGINLFNIILGFLVIVLSLQTKLGEKVEILAERTMDAVGYGTPKQNNDVKNVVKVKQPISGQGNVQPIHQASRADTANLNMMSQNFNKDTNQMLNNEVQHRGYDEGYGSSVQSRNMYETGGLPAGQNTMQQPNFDAMYQEPMAANDSYGGFAAF